MNFNEMLEGFAVGSFGSFGLIDVFLSLTVPAVLCTAVVYTYKKTQMHASFSPSFLLMLFMFSSLSGGVTLFIGENVARAFGLVGAMSIIRFRNALKEPIDAVFVLWALAIGMACGSGFYVAGAFLTVVVSGITFSVKKLGLANFDSPRTVVKVVTDSLDDEKLVEAVEKKLSAYTKEYKMLHEISNVESSQRTRVYTLTPKKNIKVKEIENQITSLPGASVYGSIYRPSSTIMD